MPLITLEYTDNLVHDWEPRPFLLNAHKLIAEIIDTDIQSCKSRIICHKKHCVGVGNYNDAYLILTVEIKPGREDAVRQKLGKDLMDALKAVLKDIDASTKLQISCHIKEVSEDYFKYTN